MSNPTTASIDQSFGTRTPRVQFFEDGTPVIYWGKGGSEGTVYIL